MKRRKIHPWGVVLACLLGVLGVAGCTSTLVSSQVSNAFHDFSTACSRDDDPDLVWDAMPFVIKLIDGRLVSAPHDTELLATAAALYTRYAYGNLAQQADFIEKKDYDRAVALRRRAGQLLVRARDYGIRGLAAGDARYLEKLRTQPAETLAAAKTADVPLLYWTACAWGAAITLSKENPELTADQFIVEALMRRSLALDEKYESGGAHEFLMTFEAARAGVGGSYERAEQHFRRAVQISGGRLTSPYVAYAEAVLAPQQKREEFVKRLEDALALPVDRDPDNRLANVVAARRAQWLLDQVDDLFLEP